MELFIKANRVSRYNLRMLYENIRIPIAIFVAMIYVMESLTNIASFSSIVNVKVTPYAFVFVINNYRVQFIIAACAIIIFGNAPYEMRHIGIWSHVPEKRHGDLDKSYILLK